MMSQLMISYKKSNIAQEKPNYRFSKVLTAVKLAFLAPNCKKKLEIWFSFLRE